MTLNGLLPGYFSTKKAQTQGAKCFSHRLAALSHPAMASRPAHKPAARSFCPIILEKHGYIGNMEPVCAMAMEAMVKM